MIVEIWFESYGQVLRKTKKVQKCLFFGNFGAILCFSRDFDAIAHTGASLGV